MRRHLDWEVQLRHCWAGLLSGLAPMAMMTGAALLPYLARWQRREKDISEDFSEDRRYHFYWILEYFRISSKSSRKIDFFWEVFGSFYPLGFYPLAVSCVQRMSTGSVLIDLQKNQQWMRNHKNRGNKQQATITQQQGGLKPRTR